MSYHDYYKLLGLSKDASLKEIKLAYRRLAKIYHPDKNPTAEGAEEYFKILTKGYNVLSNPVEKQKYDLLIRHAYSRKEEDQSEYPKGDNRNPEVIKIKLEKIRRYRDREAIQSFKTRENSLRHKIRYPIIVMIIISGYLYAFNRWFVNEASMDYLFIITGLFVYVAASFYITNHLYIHLKALNIMGRFKKFHFEKTAVTLFIILFLGGPISMAGLNAFKKYYHLKHYSMMTKPLKIDVVFDRIVYMYLYNGEYIFKSSTEYTNEELITNLQNKEPIVRFSKYNPKIARIEFRNKYEGNNMNL